MTKTLSIVALSLIAVASQAVTLDEQVLKTIAPNSTSYYYSGYGMTLSSGNPVNPIDSSPYIGAWIGNNNAQGTSTVTLAFDTAVNQVELYMTAQSNVGDANEWFNNFTTDTNAPLGFAFTNVSNSTWDGFQVSSTGDPGNWRMVISTTSSFNSLSVDYTNVNFSNGSVLQEVTYDAVPEPMSMVVLAGLAALAGRRKMRKA